MANTRINDRVFDEVANNKSLIGKSSKYLAELRYRLRHAEKGLCMYGACKRKVSGYMCNEHKTLTNSKRRNRDKI